VTAPPVTVITPTVVGRERLLKECVESVAYLGLPHMTMLDLLDEGPARVRNRLVAHVKTDWVLFLDDDDLLFPNYLDAVIPHLPSSDVVYTAWQLSGAVDPVPYPRFDPGLLRDHNFIPVTACVRTAALRAVGGFPDAELEDHALWLALLDAGYRFTYTPVIAWHYRRLPGSRTEKGAA
jgi:glycosyltransferase involved in cell wall biosynthesis